MPKREERREGEGKQAGGGEGGMGSKGPGEKMNINEASKEDLMKIPGVEEKTAESIVEYRQAHDGFKNFEELAEVENLNEENISNLREWLVIR